MFKRWYFLFLLAILPTTSVADSVTKIMVPFNAGGSTDQVARIIADPLSTLINSRVVIENKPGAGGSIATRDVARAVADGSTLLMSTVSTFGSNHAFIKNPGFDPVGDFEHVITVASTPRVLVVRSDFPADSVTDLVNLLRNHPNRYVFGTSGRSADELYTLVFNRVSKTKTIFVPYKGGAPALIDLLGGHTHLLIDNLPLVLQYVKEGKLKILAVSWHQRLTEFPLVPTWAELGYHDMNISSWQGIVAPRGTPNIKIAELNRAIATALKDPVVRDKLLQAGFYPVSDTPAQSRSLAESTYRKMTDIGSRNQVIKE